MQAVKREIPSLGTAREALDLILDPSCLVTGLILPAWPGICPLSV